MSLHQEELNNTKAAKAAIKEMLKADAQLLTIGIQDDATLLSDFKYHCKFSHEEAVAACLGVMELDQIRF